MREILFRGKRVDNGEWCEGYYVKAYTKTGLYAVPPQTAGGLQFTTDEPSTPTP